jgi:hypothetical protein
MAERAGGGQRKVKKYKHCFLAGEELEQSLERLRSVLSLRVGPNASLENILQIVVDAYLERHCPARRHRRRGSGGAYPLRFGMR